MGGKLCAVGIPEGEKGPPPPHLYPLRKASQPVGIYTLYLQQLLFIGEDAAKAAPVFQNLMGIVRPNASQGYQLQAVGGVQVHLTDAEVRFQTGKYGAVHHIHLCKIAWRVELAPFVAVVLNGLRLSAAEPQTHKIFVAYGIRVEFKEFGLGPLFQLLCHYTPGIAIFQLLFWGYAFRNSFTACDFSDGQSIVGAMKGPATGVSEGGDRLSVREQDFYARHLPVAKIRTIRGLVCFLLELLLKHIHRINAIFAVVAEHIAGKDSGLESQHQKD